MGERYWFIERWEVRWRVGRRANLSILAEKCRWRPVFRIQHEAFRPESELSPQSLAFADVSTNGEVDSLPVAFFAASLRTKDFKSSDFGNPEAARLKLPSAPTHLPYVPAVQLIRWRGEGFSFNRKSASTPGRRGRASPSCWEAKEVLGILAGNLRFHSDQGSATGPPTFNSGNLGMCANGVDA